MGLYQGEVGCAIVLGGCGLALALPGVSMLMEEAPQDINSRSAAIVKEESNSDTQPKFIIQEDPNIHWIRNNTDWLQDQGGKFTELAERWTNSAKQDKPFRLSGDDVENIALAQKFHAASKAETIRDLSKAPQK